MPAQITVSSIDALTNALANATGGETIHLAPGDYGALDLRGLNFESAVTITSADPDARAVLTETITLRDVGNLTFEGIDLIGAEPLGLYTQRIAIEDSHGITLADMAVAGALATEGRDPDAPEATNREMLKGLAHELGISVETSTGITLTGLEITQMQRGINVVDSDGVEIVGNELHDLRSDGVSFAGSSDLTIAENHMHDFHPWFGPNGVVGDHPDFIQYMGRHNGDSSMDNIVIRDNALLQGNGDHLHGIFGHAKGATMGEGDFTNFVITGNLIQVANRHGISVGEVDGGLIAGNIVIPSGIDAENGVFSRPLIDLLPSRNPDGPQDIVIEDNLLTQREDRALTTPLFDPGQYAASNISIGENAVVETGAEIPAHWLELDFGVPAEGQSMAAWIAEARAAIEAHAAEYGSFVEPGAGGPTTPDGPIVLVGGAVADDLRGETGDDTLDGKAGDDWLFGRDGDDIVVGGTGRDRLEGGSGSDLLSGGDGGDTFVFNGTDGGADTVDRIIDLDFAGGDVLSFRGFAKGTFSDDADPGNVLNLMNGAGDRVLVDSLADLAELAQSDAATLEAGTNGALRLTLAGQDGAPVVIEMTMADSAAAAGRDRLSGGADTDVLAGGAGDDFLMSRDGEDWLDGGSGNDRLTGGAGSDMLTGGTGADQFAFYADDLAPGAQDTITDLDFSEGDMLILLGFAEGRFAGDHAHLTNYGGTDRAQVHDFEGLLELDRIDGFDLARTASDMVTLYADGAQIRVLVEAATLDGLAGLSDDPLA